MYFQLSSRLLDNTSHWRLNTTPIFQVFSSGVSLAVSAVSEGGFAVLCIHSEAGIPETVVRACVEVAAASIRVKAIHIRGQAALFQLYLHHQLLLLAWASKRMCGSRNFRVSEH